MNDVVDPATFPPDIRPIAEKVAAGGRLDEADAAVAFTTPNVLHLGRLANHVRRKLHGDVAYFNVNRHINPTNVCVYTYNCKFCSFAALKDEPHAWAMSPRLAPARPRTEARRPASAIIRARVVSPFFTCHLVRPKGEQSCAFVNGS